MPAQILLFYHNVIHFVQQKQEVPEGATSIPTHPFHPIQESEESSVSRRKCCRRHFHLLSHINQYTQ